MTGPVVTAIGQWIHVAVTYDSVAGQAVFYIGGQPVVVQSLPTKPGLAGPAEAFYLGGSSDRGDPYDGLMKDAAIWNRVLSAAQIQTLATGIGPSPVPRITSLSSTSGSVGSSLVINGADFSSTPANNVVYFGAVRATVPAATPTSLTVTVPVGATYAPVSVTTGGLTAYSPLPFVVTFPGGRGIDASSFASPAEFAADGRTIGISVSDVDGDGKGDLLTASSDSSTASVLRNLSSPGSISFDTRASFPSKGAPRSVSSVDLDGDGKLDLLLCDEGGRDINVYRNTASEGVINERSFSQRQDFPVQPGTHPQTATTGDLDGDGKPEVVVADLDGNGRPDLAASSGGSDKVSVLRNTIPD